jgi:hypothetical protein
MSAEGATGFGPLHNPYAVEDSSPVPQRITTARDRLCSERLKLRCNVRNGKGDVGRSLQHASSDRLVMHGGEPFWRSLASTITLNLVLRAQFFTERRLMLASLYQVNGHSRLPECLAGFQSMQTLNQDKTFAIGPHEDRGLLPFCQHAFGKGLNLLLIKGLTPLDGHIDILDCNDLLFHHLCRSGAMIC